MNQCRCILRFQVFERKLFKQIYSYVEKFKLLDDKQFGIKRKRKTVDPLGGVLQQTEQAKVQAKLHRAFSYI